VRGVKATTRLGAVSDVLAKVTTLGEDAKADTGTSITLMLITGTGQQTNQLPHISILPQRNPQLRATQTKEPCGSAQQKPMPARRLGSSF
jgi:hypothetical protein